MKKLIYLLLPLSFILSCSDDDPNDSNPIERPKYEKAEVFYPLALGNTWELELVDSNSSGIDKMMVKEVVDSCCYYINLYFDGPEESSGWKWRDFTEETMYANGGNKLYTTEYIDKEKGSWYRIDSTVAHNTVITDVASGLYEGRDRCRQF